DQRAQRRRQLASHAFLHPLDAAQRRLRFVAIHARRQVTGLHPALVALGGIRGEGRGGDGDGDEKWEHRPITHVGLLWPKNGEETLYAASETRKLLQRKIVDNLLQ